MTPCMTPPMKRLVAAVLWTAAFTLLIVGSSMGFGERLPYFAWSIVLCFLACVVTGYLIVEHVVDRRTDETARRIAAAVGVAVGQHLAGGEPRKEPTRVTPIR